MFAKVLDVVIMSLDDYRKRIIGIAMTDCTPGKDEPKVWFESYVSTLQGG